MNKVYKLLIVVGIFCITTEAEEQNTETSGIALVWYPIPVTLNEIQSKFNETTPLLSTPLLLYIYGLKNLPNIDSGCQETDINRRSITDSPQLHGNCKQILKKFNIHELFNSILNQFKQPTRTLNNRRTTSYSVYPNRTTDYINPFTTIPYDESNNSSGKKDIVSRLITDVGDRENQEAEEDLLKKSSNTEDDLLENTSINPENSSDVTSKPNISVSATGTYTKQRVTLSLTPTVPNEIATSLIKRASHGKNLKITTDSSNYNEEDKVVTRLLDEFSTTSVRTPKSYKKMPLNDSKSLNKLKITNYSGIKKHNVGTILSDQVSSPSVGVLKLDGAIDTKTSNNLKFNEEITTVNTSLIKTNNSSSKEQVSDNYLSTSEEYPDYSQENDKNNESINYTTDLSTSKDKAQEVINASFATTTELSIENKQASKEKDTTESNELLYTNSNFIPVSNLNKTYLNIEDENINNASAQPNSTELEQFLNILHNTCKCL